MTTAKAIRVGFVAEPLICQSRISWFFQRED
jgi:hypothetical protein